MGRLGEAFYDDSTNNPYNSGSSYRNESVDIEACSDSAPSIGYDVGWLDASKMLKYTATILVPGTYAVSARVAGGNAGGSFYLEIGGSNVTGIIQVPATEGWQSWSTLPARTFTIAEPATSFKFVVVSAGFNLNWLRFDSLNAPALGAERSGNSLLLSWPASATNFSLYGTTGLTLPLTWSAVTNPVIKQNGSFTVSVPIEMGAQLFRLEKH